MPNLPYIAYRLLRRCAPTALTYLFASRDRLAPEALREDAGLYGRLLAEAGVDVRGATVVEIGPGTYNPFSLLLLKSGARKIILQEPFPRGLDYLRLRTRLERFWEWVPGLPGDVSRPSDFLSPSGFLPDRVELHQGFADRLPCADGSADLILSSMMMQFAENAEAVFREAYRALRPGGYLLHVVDLRDHFFRYPFEMLAYSDAAWSLLSPLREGRGYHNRLRGPDYLRLLAAAGFADAACRPLGRDREGYLKVKARLQPRFRGIPDGDMDVTVAAVSARKP